MNIFGCLIDFTHGCNHFLHPLIALKDILFCLQYNLVYFICLAGIILGFACNIRNSSEGIAKASNEQASATAQIDQALMQVSQVVQTNSATITFFFIILIRTALKQSLPPFISLTGRLWRHRFT